MKTNDYRQLISQLAKKKVNRRITNGEVAHAAALFEGMLHTTEHELCIFTRSLEPKVFDSANVQTAFWRFLQDADHKLSILMQDPSDFENRSLAFLARSGLRRAKVEVRRATGSYASPEAKHFAVMDARAFRFEFDHTDCAAIANFNEPETAQELSAAFAKAFAMAERVREFT